MMWQSLHALYRGVIDYGGFPIHAALFERNGVGALLVAGEGVGKSTCASRIPAPWRALSDDAAVVTPLGASRYIAHPFPTWSALLQGRDDLTWSVQTGVPLAAIFFLERGDKDEVIPVGQGRAAFMTHASAWYICSRGMPDASKCDKADFNKRIFLNTCEPVRRIPAYILRATLEGAFWKEMDKVVPV